MMAAAEQAKIRILTPEEMVVEDLKKRHADRLLLVEARSVAGGGTRLLAVLDVDGETLTAERGHLASRDGLAVEVIDRATWEAMRRLAATGLLHMAEGSARSLHQAPGFTPAEDATADMAARVADLLAQADRSRRMGAVLAAGGFPEEAAPLLAKALALAGAARLAERNELPLGATMATPEQIRNLAEAGALPAAAVTTLLALWPGGGATDITALAEATGRVVDVVRGHPAPSS